LCFIVPFPGSSVLSEESKTPDALQQWMSALIDLTLLLPLSGGLTSRTNRPARHGNCPNHRLATVVYHCVANWCLHAAPLSLSMFVQVTEQEKTPG
jgi:hypothetical protein